MLMKIKDFFHILLGVILLFPAFYISYDILSAQIKSYPIMNETRSEAWRYNFYLKHYKGNPNELISVYDITSVNKIVKFLNYSNFSLQDSKILEDDVYKIYQELHNKYLFDYSLIMNNILLLLQKKQYIQAYTILDNSYLIVPCYAPFMRYRIELKEKYRLFIMDKIQDDTQSLQQRRCLAPINTTNNNLSL